MKRRKIRVFGVFKYELPWTPEQQEKLKKIFGSPQAIQAVEESQRIARSEASELNKMLKAPCLRGRPFLIHKMSKILVCHYKAFRFGIIISIELLANSVLISFATLHIPKNTFASSVFFLVN